MLLQTIELGQQEVHQWLRWLQTEAGVGTGTGAGMQTHAGKHHGQDIPGLRLYSATGRYGVLRLQAHQGVEQAGQGPRPYGFPGQHVRCSGGRWRGCLYCHFQDVPLTLRQRHLVENRPHGCMGARALP